MQEQPVISTQCDRKDRSVVPAHTFEDLKVGDVFRAPSRSLTDAHAAAFQTISAQNVWAARRGNWAPEVHGLQVLAFSALATTLFPHYIGEVYFAFTELSCKFLKKVHSGDTLYPAVEITSLEKQNTTGVVTTAVSIFNQRDELVLSGEHKQTLKLS